MIGTRNTPLGQYLPGKRAQAPLHPVADDGVPDFLAYRKANPHRRASIAPVTHQQHEAGRRRALACVRGEKIAALR